MTKFKIQLKEEKITNYWVEADDYDQACNYIEEGSFDKQGTNIDEYDFTIISANDVELLKNWGEVDGTSLQGYMDISYEKIYDILGEPNLETDGYKTDAEWGIRFPDTGEVATIYNYKTGTNYLGAEGLDPQDIRDWHIGGRDKSIVERVCKLLNTKEVDYLTARYGGK